MQPVELEFRSQLGVSPARAWAWISSFEGVGREMWPWSRMTAPRGVTHLADPGPALGQPLFRSRLFVLGFVPFGHTDLTLLKFTEGVGFVEQSPMTGMRLWRHERTIEPSAGGCTVIDKLTFEPRFARPLVAWYVRRVFMHRHAVLRRFMAS